MQTTRFLGLTCPGFDAARISSFMSDFDFSNAAFNSMISALAFSSAASVAWSRSSASCTFFSVSAFDSIAFGPSIGNVASPIFRGASALVINCSVEIAPGESFAVLEKAIMDSLCSTIECSMVYALEWGWVYTLAEICETRICNHSVKRMRTKGKVEGEQSRAEVGRREVVKLSVRGNISGFFPTHIHPNVTK